MRSSSGSRSASVMGLKLRLVRAGFSVVFSRVAVSFVGMVASVVNAGSPPSARVARVFLSAVVLSLSDTFEEPSWLGLGALRLAAEFRQWKTCCHRTP